MAPPRYVLTILAVADLGRAREFYSAVLAWPQLVDDPLYAEFGRPDGMRLGLYAREAFGRNTGQLPGPPCPGEITSTELYIHVDDLDAVVDRMERVGARSLSPPAERPWGDVVAYFADPDGNVLAIAQPDRE